MDIDSKTKNRLTKTMVFLRNEPKILNAVRCTLIAVLPNEPKLEPSTREKTKRTQKLGGIYKELEVKRENPSLLIFFASRAILVTP